MPNWSRRNRTLHATTHGMKRIEERSPIQEPERIVKWLIRHTERAYQGSSDFRVYLVVEVGPSGMGGEKPPRGRQKKISYVYVFGRDKRLITMYQKDIYISIRVMFKSGLKKMDKDVALEYLFGQPVE